MSLSDLSVKETMQQRRIREFEQTLNQLEEKERAQLRDLARAKEDVKALKEEYVSHKRTAEDKENVEVENMKAEVISSTVLLLYILRLTLHASALSLDYFAQEGT